MIDHIYKSLYNQDSVNKQITISFDDGTITNKELYSESFELTESICSETELYFGSCEASCLKFKIANTVGTLLDKVITVTEVLDGMTEELFQFGKYKVYSDVPSGDRNYRNITAYDEMYDIINADVSEWYAGLEFPMTQKDFRNSFFEYVGVTQEETELIHDEMEIEETISGTGISGKLIITSICELNGVFGHINRNGNFTYISLATKKSDAIYPMTELYPASYLYATSEYTNGVLPESIEKSIYISCEYEDFDTSYITKLQIRQEENDIGAISGDGTNSYIIEGNFLVYGKTEEALQDIADKTLEKIRYTQYKPFKAKMKGNPCLEVGDLLVFHTRYGDVESYILERTISGIQHLTDNLVSDGVKEYTEKVNSTKNDIRQLKGKANILERNLDETRSEVKDIETGLRTEVVQTTEEIIASVLKEYVELTTHEEFRQTIEAQLSLVSDELALKFTQMTEELENINGDLQSQINTITKYFTFSVDGMIIGQVDNPYKMILDNDRFSMTVNDVEVLWIDATTRSTYTPKLVVTEQFEMLGILMEIEEVEGLGKRLNAY